MDIALGLRRTRSSLVYLVLDARLYLGKSSVRSPSQLWRVEINFGVIVDRRQAGL